MFPLLLLSTTLARDSETGYGYRPIELDKIAVADAKNLQGHLVPTTFTITAPPDTQDGVTVIGCEAGGVERTALLPENWRLNAGDEVTIEGELRVIEHAPSVINGVRFPGFTEIRVRDARLVKRKE